LQTFQKFPILQRFLRPISPRLEESDSALFPKALKHFNYSKMKGFFCYCFLLCTVMSGSWILQVEGQSHHTANCWKPLPSPLALAVSTSWEGVWWPDAPISFDKDHSQLILGGHDAEWSMLSSDNLAGDETFWVFAHNGFYGRLLLVRVMQEQEPIDQQDVGSANSNSNLYLLMTRSTAGRLYGHCLDVSREIDRPWCRWLSKVENAKDDNLFLFFGDVILAFPPEERVDATVQLQLAKKLQERLAEHCPFGSCC